MRKSAGVGHVWALPALALVAAQAAEPPGPTPDFMAQAMRELPLEGAPQAVAGPYRVVTEAAPGTPHVEIRRPADVSPFPSRDRLPVVVWGNGGCLVNTPNGDFLATLASHGFLVLTTAGPAGPPTMADPQDLTALLDWAFAENARQGAPLRGRIDLEHVAMMGHSCGGYIALANAADPRIDTLGMWSAGASDEVPGRPTARWPPTTILKSLHGTVLYIDGGEADISKPMVQANFDAIDHVPVFYGSRNNAGHGGTYNHPGGGEYANIAVDWLKWQLKGNATAGRTFAGAGCGLCTDRNWVVRSKRL